MKIINYDKTYVENPTNEFELKLDSNIENEIKTLRFKQHFIYLLIDTYYNFIKKGCQKKDWIQYDGDIITKFLEDYTITDNQNDYTPSAEIESWLKSKDYGITMTKFGKYLKKHINIKKFENVVNKKKKVNKKSIQVWIGIKEL